MTTRRRFLGLLGLAATAPLAAQAVKLLPVPVSENPIFKGATGYIDGLTIIPRPAYITATEIIERQRESIEAFNAAMNAHAKACKWWSDRLDQMLFEELSSEAS